MKLSVRLKGNIIKHYKIWDGETCATNVWLPPPPLHWFNCFCSYQRPEDSTFYWNHLQRKMSWISRSFKAGTISTGVGSDYKFTSLLKYFICFHSNWSYVSRNSLLGRSYNHFSQALVRYCESASIFLIYYYIFNILYIHIITLIYCLMSFLIFSVMNKLLHP